MATVVNGLFFSDQAEGEKEDVSQDMMEAIPSQIPFLNSIGWPGNVQADALVHKYYDEAYVPQKTTLNGAVASGATQLVLTDGLGKVGMRALGNGELMSLDACPTGDNKTFTISRSVGTIAAQSHSSGDVITLLAAATAQGVDPGNADATMEPRLVTNYCQGIELVVEVPDEADKQILHGRTGSRYDNNVRQKLRDAAILCETTAMWGKKNAAAPTPSSSGKYWQDGIFERVVGTNHLQMGTTDITHDSLRTISDAIAEYWDQEEGINVVLMLPFRQKHRIDEWKHAHIVDQQGSPTVRKYGVNVRQVEIGAVIFDVIAVNARVSNGGKMGFAYNPSFLQVATYLPMTHEILARTKRTVKGIISGNWCLEAYCPEAHYAISGFKNS